MKRKTAKFTALAMTAIIMISMLCGCSSNAGAAKGNTASADPDSMFQDLTITILPDDVQPADAEEEGWKTSYPDGLCVRFNGFDEEQYARYLSHPNNTQVDPRKAKLGDIWLGYAADSEIDIYCNYTDKDAERSDKALYRMLLEKSRYTIDFNETDYTYDDLIGLADSFKHTSFQGTIGAGFVMQFSRF